MKPKTGWVPGLAGLILYCLPAIATAQPVDFAFARAKAERRETQYLVAAVQRESEWIVVSLYASTATLMGTDPTWKAERISGSANSEPSRASTDSLSCAQLVPSLKALRHEQPAFETAGSPGVPPVVLHGWIYQLSYVAMDPRGGMPTGRVDVRAVRGGVLARWFEETLAAMEPCWRPVD